VKLKSKFPINISRAFTLILSSTIKTCEQTGSSTKDCFRVTGFRWTRSSHMDLSNYGLFPDQHCVLSLITLLGKAASGSAKRSYYWYPSKTYAEIEQKHFELTNEECYIDGLSDILNNTW